MKKDKGAKEILLPMIKDECKDEFIKCWNEMLDEITKENSILIKEATEFKEKLKAEYEKQIIDHEKLVKELQKIVEQCGHCEKNNIDQFLMNVKGLKIN